MQLYDKIEIIFIIDIKTACLGIKMPISHSEVIA